MLTVLTSIGRIYTIDSISESHGDANAHPALSLAAARAIGQEMADNIEQWFQAGRGRRLDNLSYHLERAMGAIGRETVGSIAETPAFAEWAEGVSKVELTDQALADVWQAALLGLQKDSVGRLRALRIAQSLQPDEAATFLALSRGRAITEAYVERLKALGLVKTVKNRLFNRFSIFTYMLTFSLACLAGTLMLTSPNLFPQIETLWSGLREFVQTQVNLRLSPTAFVVIMGSLCAAVPMLLHLFLDATPLSEDGKILSALLKKVRAAPKDAKVGRAAAAAPIGKLALAA